MIKTQTQQSKTNELLALIDKVSPSLSSTEDAFRTLILPYSGQEHRFTKHWHKPIKRIRLG